MLCVCVCGIKNDEVNKIMQVLRSLSSHDMVRLPEGLDQEERTCKPGSAADYAA